MRIDKVNNNFNISFDTKISIHNSKLLLETGLNDKLSFYSENITRKIVETEDELTKKALKSLGWIAPEDAKIIHHLLRQLAGEQSFDRGGWGNVDEEVKELLKEVFNERV